MTEPVFGSGLYERFLKKNRIYTVGHLFMYYKIQLSEFIFKEIMQTR